MLPGALWGVQNSIGGLQSLDYPPFHKMEEFSNLGSLWGTPK